MARQPHTVRRLRLLTRAVKVEAKELYVTALAVLSQLDEIESAGAEDDPEVQRLLQQLGRRVGAMHARLKGRPLLPSGPL